MLNNCLSLVWKSRGLCIVMINNQTHHVVFEAYCEVVILRVWKLTQIAFEFVVKCHTNNLIHMTY